MGLLATNKKSYGFIWSDFFNGRAGPRIPRIPSSDFCLESAWGDCSQLPGWAVANWSGDEFDVPDKARARKAMEFVNDWPDSGRLGGNSSHFPGFSKSSSHNKGPNSCGLYTFCGTPWHPWKTQKKHKKTSETSSSAGATCSSPAAKSHWDRWVAVRPCGPRFRNHQAPGVLRARKRWAAWKVHEGPVFTIGQHGSVFWYVLVNSNPYAPCMEYLPTFALKIIQM